MCYAIPGRIIAVEGDMGTVDFGGVRKKANLTILPSAKKGDYVLVHAGFAIERLSRRSAEESLKLIKELGEAAER
jgi:hydrogenase expression/formation protein HypC